MGECSVTAQPLKTKEKVWHVHVPAVYHQQTAWHRLPLFVSVKRRRKAKGILKFIRSRWPSYVPIKVFQLQNEHKAFTHCGRKGADMCFHFSTGALLHNFKDQELKFSLMCDRETLASIYVSVNEDGTFANPRLDGGGIWRSTSSSSGVGEVEGSKSGDPPPLPFLYTLYSTRPLTSIVLGSEKVLPISPPFIASPPTTVPPPANNPPLAVTAQAQTSALKRA